MKSTSNTKGRKIQHILTNNKSLSEKEIVKKLLTDIENEMTIIRLSQLSIDHKMAQLKILNNK